MSINDGDGSKPSWIITALIGAGILLIIVGLILTTIGFIGPVFQASYGNLIVKTTSVGLVLTIIGAILGGYVTTRLPKHLRPFNAGGPKPRERRTRWAILLFFLIALAGIVALVLSYVWGL